MAEMDFNPGNLNLGVAVESYSRGIPVVVISGDGCLLHGRETVDVIAQLGTALKSFVIHGVSGDDWNNSDWPELLEAARQVFMEQGGFRIRRSDQH